MSYSFNFRSVNKIAATTDAETEFDKVVASQPAHAKDKAAALANVGQALALLPDDEPVIVQMNGWLTYRGQDADRIEGVSISAQASIAPPQA